jgi:hypothetical protein
MSETPTGVGAADDRSTEESERKSPLWVQRETSAPGGDGAREAARALAGFGAWLGWGLLVLGVLVGIGRGLEPMVGGSASPAGWITAVVDGVSWTLAFGLAGRGAAVSCRLVAALVLARIERAGHAADPLIAQAARGADGLERLILVGGPMAARPASGETAAADRGRSLAEIERAIRAERWAETESLVDAFGRAFPEDSTLPDLRDRLDAGRRQATEGQMARIDAARKVNDPARVIELYHGIVPSLDVDQREELARDLAKWFLELIHRRLRTGKIQAEVVLLATQVAETFGATVEGASMRAALPTLRRSVGLCPRCAQPYTGTADACPQCLAGALGVAGRPSSDRPPLPS